MKKYFCDVCEKEYKENDNYFIRIMIERHDISDKYYRWSSNRPDDNTSKDLCLNCYQKLKNKINELLRAFNYEI